MDRTELKKRGATSLLLLLPALLLGGCSGKGVGDTVPSPPRALVERSFHPPAGAVRPEASRPGAVGAANSGTTK